MFRCLISLGSVSALVFSVQAQSTSGTGHVQSPFVLPVVKRDSLLNGLQLITLEQAGTGSVSVHLRINSGAIFDLAGKGGLADLTAGMLLRGGGGLGARNVSDTVEHAGLTVSVKVDWDSTDIVLSGPADSIEIVFDLISRLIITPAFEQKEFDDLKSIRLADLKQAASDVEEARVRALEEAYGSHPFGRAMRGSAASLAQIARADLSFYHTRYYLANNSELVVSGDVTAEQVTRLARSKLGAWRKGEKIQPTFRAPDPQTTRKVTILDRPQSTSSYAVICQQGFSRRSDNYFAAMVMMGILSQTLSKPAGAGNSAVTEVHYEPHLLAGPVVIVIKSDGDGLPLAIDAALQSMAGIQESPPSAEQVEAAKSRILSQMSDRLKTPDGTAEVILDIETFGLGRDYLINFADRLATVAPADVQSAARAQLHPQAVAVAVCGPAAKLEAPLKKLGSVALVK